MPHLTLIAGPNGAGKSTLSADLTEAGGPLEEVEVIDPDRIARELRPDDPEAAAFAAGREALRREQELLDAEKSFAVETTLSGNRGLRLLRVAAERGYDTRLIYLGVESAEQSRRRVEQRVREGGHDVPAEAVRRRYNRSLSHLPDATREAGRALVFDNSRPGQMRPLLEVRTGRVRFVARKQPEWFQQVFGKGQPPALGQRLGPSRGKSPDDSLSSSKRESGDHGKKNEGEDGRERGASDKDASDKDASDRERGTL